MPSQLRQCEAAKAIDAAGEAGGSPEYPVVTAITIPWTGPVPAAVKGIIHVPAHSTPIKPSRRETLLIAIAKARKWADDLAHGRAASFAAIARREGKVERHVRLLAPLAFVSPRIVAAILDATAPAGLTVTALARALPWSWAEQERQVGVQSHCAGDDGQPS
jgi:site-specific DNA recombinase